MGGWLGACVPRVWGTAPRGWVIFIGAAVAGGDSWRPLKPACGVVGPWMGGYGAGGWGMSLDDGV